MDFDYDSLVVLSAVVRTGSFEAAAKRLEVTQSAVSQRIKQLEEKVGSILILRGRPCVATEDGLLLVQHVEQVTLLQHELSELLTSRGEAAGAATVSLRIAVNSDSLATWFPSVISRAADEVNLRLEVIPDDQEFTEERLRSGDALAIVTSTDKSIPGCQTYPLGSMEYLAIASPEYRDRYLKDGINLETLAMSPSIRFDRKDTLPRSWLIEAFGDAKKLSSHFVPSYEAHLVSCLEHIGWAMMPYEAVAPHIEAGRLFELVPNKRVQIPLYWTSRSQSSNILNKLSQIVSEVAQERLEGAQGIPEVI
ncbi:MAG: LysR family transcriptional regulator ArgP [Boseongicola sp.]|nr:LysR family transcriptional regulator ArgP [Boseongicola sp.]MDD9979104.1 LysR family transcriptional regulator ArgP [Boseongicola sp.]